MRPFLFSIGSRPVSSFFLMIVLAALVATLYACWVGRKNGLKVDVLLDMGIIGLISAVLGARIFHILVEYPHYYWEKPARIFQFGQGGFVSWGGFIAIGLSFLVYFRKKKLPVLPYFDVLCVAAPIIKFFVRVACLLAGCCYGKPTGLPWAISFTHKGSTAYYFMGTTPLHPTQVYSMIHALLLFFLVNWVYRRSHKVSGGRSPSGANDQKNLQPDGGSGGRAGSPPGFDGQTTCVLAMGWTLPRAFIELFRGDVDRGVYFGGLVSTGQIAGIAIFLFFFWMYRYLRKHAA